MTNRTTTWNTPYTFSGKEKDVETGYGYFGARYYDSGLSIWLSVDPMSDKYPSMSPYNYCANNPVILVDPDGRVIILTGPDAGEGANQLNAQTIFAFGVKLGEDGKTLTYSGIALTKKDRALKRMIKEKDVTVEMKCRNDNNFRTPNGTIHSEYGGAYGGNEFDDENGATATQYVSPSMLANYDAQFNDNSFGETMLHEAAEAFAGGKLALDNFQPYIGLGDENPSYDYAHKKANEVALGNFAPLIVRDIGGYEIRGKIKCGLISFPNIIFNPNKKVDRQIGIVRTK